MRRPRLFHRIFLYFLLLSVAGLAFITWKDVREFRKTYLAQTEESLKDRAQLLRVAFLPLYRAANQTNADSVCNQAKASATRITLILANGKVLADSKADPDTMENHAYRPEINSAMAGEVGVSTRYSATRNLGMMYVAVPVTEKGILLGVLRVSIPLEQIKTGLRGIYGRSIGAALLAVLLIALVSYILSKQIAGPIKALEAGAGQIANGDFAVKLAEGPFKETSRLARAVNGMAQQLHDRFQTIVEQKKKQEAMVNSMSEGVIAVDIQARIIELNPAAAGMLQASIGAARGRHAHEVIHNSDLQEFVERTLACKKPIEADINWMRHQDERFLQAHGTSIRDEAGNLVGGLIVLNDITGIRKLERVRRDFVANVSHELRTPLTSIKGFAETLSQNSESMDPDELRRFLSIITQQADRLNTLVDDLLTLSRIENQEEKHQLQLEECDLAGVLLSARDAVLVQAKDKGIEIDVEIPPEFFVRADPAMVEQAVTNLLDNAVKYSPNQSRIQVRGTKRDHEIAISVSDQGIGIEPRHIPHLFERFYRVDKARSRKAGGTGLGLSIVKHIVLLHRGHVDVQSVPGKGSTFTIILPVLNR